MSEPVYSFGAWVRLRRQSLVLTREQLSQRVGCAEVTIREIESDERRPSAQIAELLAHHLAIPTEQHELFVRVARGVETVERLPSAVGLTLVVARTSDAPAATSRLASNLPLAPNALIGRDDDLAGIERMLTGDARLVTLTGAGGSGKTRLALEVGRQIQERYPDGVWFVDLAPITDGSQVAAAIAQALGINQAPGQSIQATVLAWLRTKTLLLILDNCEQVVAGAAELATHMLHALPHQGDIKTAIAVIEPYLHYRGFVGGMFEARQAHTELALAAIGGHVPDAVTRLQQAFLIWLPTRARREIVRLLEGCAGLMAANGATDIAARIWGAAEALREQIGSVIWPVDQQGHECQVAEARTQVDTAAFDAAWQAGRLLTWEQAADEALTWLDNAAT